MTITNMIEPNTDITIFPNGKYAMLIDESLAELKPIPNDNKSSEVFVEKSIVRQGNVIFLYNWNVKYVVDVTRRISVSDMVKEIMEVNHGPLSTLTREVFKSKVKRIAEEARFRGETVNVDVHNYLF